MKKFWHKNVHPEIPKEVFDKVTSYEKIERMRDKGEKLYMNWDANGYTDDRGMFRKDGKLISVPICRECQVQAPCSEWGGEYPYEREE